MVYLSIILPAYNEEKAIKPVIDDITKNVAIEYEIIVIDDGSKDSTCKIAGGLDNPKLRLISHETNRGKPEAIRTGIKNAKGKVVVLMDADHTYPAEYIEPAVKKLESGYHIVLGNRFAGSANIPSVNKLGNIFFSLLISYYTSNKIHDSQTGFRVFRKDIFDQIDVAAKGLEYETKQTMQALYSGYSISEIPITYRKRIGNSKLKWFTDGYRMLRAIFSVAYTNMFISTRFFVLLAGLLFIIGLAFGIISLNEKISYGVLTHGYYPIISTMAVILSFQAFSLGIVMDSLGRQLNRIEKQLHKPR